MSNLIKYKLARYLSLEYSSPTIIISEGTLFTADWDLIDLNSKGIKLCSGEDVPDWFDVDEDSKLKIIGVDLSD